MTSTIKIPCTDKYYPLLCCPVYPLTQHWHDILHKLAADGARLAPRDAKALKDLCAGATWMQSLPPALLASYRALYVVLRGCAADAEEEINRCETKYIIDSP